MAGEREEARRGKESLSGGHLCRVCGYQSPNANPSAKLRRAHRKNCRKMPAAEGQDAGAVSDWREEDAAAERNAGEGLPLGGEPEGNGGASEANGGSELRGSAKGDADLVEDKESAEHSSPNGAGVQIITDDCSETGLINYISDSVEITKEGNRTNLERDCTNGNQNKVAEHRSEISSLAVGHLVEREDSLDEYQDASPFLHHSDSEGGAAEDKSDFSVEEIKNSKSASLGASAPANEISAQMNGLWKDQFSGEPNLTDLSADYKVGKEDGCNSEQKSAPGLAEPTMKLENSDGCSTNVHCDNTYMVDSKPGKTFDCSEFVGDVNGSTQLISDLESQSSCPRKVESFMGDSIDALHTMFEVSFSPEEAEPAIVESETTNNSKTDFVQTGDELKLINAVNTSTDCSSQYKYCKDTSYVQLPVENSYLDNSVSSVDCYQSDHVVKSMGGILGSVHEVKGSELGFSCEERPQLVKLLVNISEENLSVEKPNGFAVEVCNKGIGLEVPTIDQVSASQEHIALVMDQMPCIKNPFILDDTKSDDLFELATESYYSEVSNVAESKLHGDFTSLPLDQLMVSDQISNTEGQHSVISDDHILAVLTTCENGFAVGTEDMSVSSTSDPTNNISLHDISVSHSMQEDGEHTSGISFVPSQVFPAEFSTMPTSQEINALETDVDEKTLAEDMSTNDMTAAHSADNAKEKRETEDTSVKEMDPILKADNVEEEKLTDDTSAEMNAVQHKDDAKKKQADDTGMETSAAQNLKESEQAKYIVAKGIYVVGSMENADVEKQTEDISAKEMKAEIKTDYADGQKQTNDTSTEEMNEKMQLDTCSKETYTIQSTDNAEQKRTEDPVGQEGNKDNAEEQKHTEYPVGREGIKENEEISITGAKQNPERIHVPLKVLLAEASVETKVKKTSAKERVLSFRRRVSKGGDSGSLKAGANNKFWNSPARLPENNNAEKRSKGRKHPWMLFICCYSVH
ncbi:hypothetical protein ABZP36_036184 [Zizania latifolia]